MGYSSRSSDFALGTLIIEFTRKLCVLETTFYDSMKRFGSLGNTESVSCANCARRTRVSSRPWNPLRLEACPAAGETSQRRVRIGNVGFEIWSTVANVGTFVVIAATAIVALAQLRHVRSGNQIAVFAQLQATAERPEERESLRFILQELPERIKDPIFRQALAEDPVGSEARIILPWIHLCGSIGTVIKRGFIEPGVVLDTYGMIILRSWKASASAVSILRRTQGNQTCMNFEYVAALYERDRERIEVYPQGVGRMPVDTRWLTPGEADEPRNLGEAGIEPVTPRV